MTAQLHLAQAIVRGRAHAEQDLALLREVELARQIEREARRRRSSDR